MVGCDNNSIAVWCSGAAVPLGAGAVDASTLVGKFMMGFQGWFVSAVQCSHLNLPRHSFRNAPDSSAAGACGFTQATPCDGYKVGWSHWSRGNRTPGPDPNVQGFLDFDSWPDMVSSHTVRRGLCFPSLLLTDRNDGFVVITVRVRPGRALPHQPALRQWLHRR
jgi:hypothetical protein